MRFLHTADWQIGMKAAHTGAAADRVRDARFAAARRVIELAHEHHAEFILVAGDTFEDNAVDRVLVQCVADGLAQFRGPVFLIAGNHDPLAPGSVWEHAAWKSHANLHVLPHAGVYNVPGGKLWAAPLTAKYGRLDPTRDFQARAETEIAIGLAHGTVQGIVQEEQDFPIPQDAAARAGLDYLALGHWHSTATYPDQAGATRMAYSGTHEQTKFGERDSGNVLLVEIPERGAAPRVTPLRSGTLRWRSLTAQIATAADVAAVVRQLETESDPAHTLLEIKLQGLLEPQSQPELTRLHEVATARFLSRRIDDEQLIPSPSDARWQESLAPGLLRSAAAELTRLADPTTPRDGDVTPAIASRALLELYRLWRETHV